MILTRRTSQTVGRFHRSVRPVILAVTLTTMLPAVALAQSEQVASRDVADMISACTSPIEAFIKAHAADGLTPSDLLTAISENYTLLEAKSKEDLAAAVAAPRSAEDTDESYAATLCGAKRRQAQLDGSVSSATMGSGLSASDSAVFLLPGEYYIRTKDNCGLVWRPTYATMARGDTAVARVRLMSANGTYPGVCVDGFVHGELRTAISNGDGERIFWFARGRQLLRGEVNFTRAPGARTIQFGVRDANGAIRNAVVPNTPNPFVPVWGFPQAEVFTTLHGDDGNDVSTVKADCLTAARTLMGTDTSGRGPEFHFPGCNAPDRFAVFGVATRTRSNPTWQATWCPDPKTSDGCAAVWEAVGGTIISRMKMFRAEAEAFEAAERLRYAERWAALQAKRSGEALAVKKEELRELDAAEAKVAAAAKAFRATLVGKNAGQLYAMADSLVDEGQLLQSREVLRTLLSRYPSHALAQSAAKMLADLKEKPQ